jgi:flagellar motor switch protein FliN/FliY
VDNQRNNQAACIFASAFAASVTESLTQVIGLPWQLRVLDSPDPTTHTAQSVHFRLTVGGTLHGECFAEFYQPQVAELGSKILGQPLSPFSNEHGEALAKVISSAMAGFSSALFAEYGALTFEVARVEDLVVGEMFVVHLAASGGDQPDMPVLLYFDGPLLEALSSMPAIKPATETETPPIDPVNLQLVMDVELNVSLRFGQRQLPLREVLDLTSGSLIELDTRVDDPVELLLDGKVIARGEAVIIDGNYGLRITEIPQPIASHFFS